MEDAAPLNQPKVSAEYPAVADDETDEGEEEQAAALVVATSAAKKRGRPAGSKNKAPDVYTALLDRMTQLEETLSRRPPPESSTGGSPETPPATRPKRHARPRQVATPVRVILSQADIFLNQITQTREQRRQEERDFYARKAMPTKGQSRAAIAKILEDRRKSFPQRVGGPRKECLPPWSSAKSAIG